MNNMFRWFTKSPALTNEVTHYLIGTQELREARGEYLNNHENYLEALKALKRLRGVSPYSGIKYTPQTEKAVRKALRRFYSV